MSSKEIEKALYHFFTQYDIEINPLEKQYTKTKKKSTTLKKGGHNQNDIIPYPKFCTQQEVKEIEQFAKEMRDNKYNLKDIDIKIMSDRK
jgi:hypothetical protein